MNIFLTAAFFQLHKQCRHQAFNLQSKAAFRGSTF